DLLRPDFDEEEIKPAAGKIDQHCLVWRAGAAVPADPGRQIVDAQQHRHSRPFDTSERAIHALWMYGNALLIKTAFMRGIDSLDVMDVNAGGSRFWGRHGYAPLLTAPQRVNINGQTFYGDRIEPAHPRWHDTIAAVGYRFPDGGAIAAVKPNGVRQIGRALDTVTFTFIAVTHGAVIGKHRSPGRGPRFIMIL